VRDGLRDGAVAHAGLDDRRAGERVDVDDAVELGQRQQHAPPMRQGAAGQAGARPARNDRHVEIEAGAADARDLLLGLGQRHHHRHLAIQRQAVALVRLRVLFAPEDAVVRQERAQRGHDRALALDVDGARAFERDALAEHLRRNGAWCVHRKRDYTSRPCVTGTRRAATKERRAWDILHASRHGKARPGNR
jgi:hypothetical protein